MGYILPMSKEPNESDDKQPDETPAPDTRNPAAVALNALRMTSMTPEARRRVALRANAVRWAKRKRPTA